ncbi:hypothetical protein CLAFUW4_09466 [Fulvia fulva]|uniref:Uncharacterized protein n=1 Tax=Passalora fulva TaxID=5499 RepID=A0A9Q8PFA2_PASFU|nr:uncharacterized protein CLAFUR5_09563 [Fulvia fulva]KAK4613494.1 hypothetical protein CLAFUR4_09472 [Fulvia fulva]KAK4614740.1 hypothetical protein CLAFUR0_09463 [Fulvia fulva]UJO21426.1 hypothetical protein CLAFUR5_09563 [Fulvia fulva]WPV20380.1 hypothetical protein CLAFUW4_09466 [Fulvia fulva]WPV35431.1 hypothetical protein CLAFUW7_09467 [Fulvia fulva]
MSDVTRNPPIPSQPGPAPSDASSAATPPPATIVDGPNNQDPNRVYYMGLVRELMRNGNTNTATFGQSRIQMSLVNLVLAYRHLVRAGVPTIADEVWVVGRATFGEARMRDALAIVPG